MAPLRTTILLAALLLTRGDGMSAIAADSGYEGAQRSREAAPSTPEGRLLGHIEAMTASDASPEDRAEHARAVVGSDDALAIGVVVRELGVESVYADELRRAVREHPTPPDHLVPALLKALDSDDARVRDHAIGLLARWPTREVARAIVTRMGAEPLLPRTDRERCARALRSMLALRAGQGPASDTPQAWQAWLDERAALDEGEWDRALRDRFRALADERARAVEETSRTLREAYRRLYSMLPEDERSPFIAELLRSDRAGVRTLGFEIAQQALLNARVLGPEVRAAALLSASHPDPSIRRNAASMVERVGSDGADDTDALIGWLERERDAQAVTPLLRLVSNEPTMRTRATASPVMRWLGSEGEPMDAAMEAALALQRAGLLAEDQSSELARVAQRALETAPTALRVRVVGEVGDRALLVPLLGANGDVAITAARALASDPSHIDAVLVAARADSRMFPIASGALRTLRPEASSLATLRTLPASDADLKRRHASLLVRAMPPAQQLEAIAGIEGAGERASLLAHTGDAAFHAEDDAFGHRTALVVAL
ncbi:MAG: hypothetical protein AAGH64_07870, partial [Planctomycetota bacterium]